MAGLRLHSRLRVQRAPNPSPASRPRLPGRWVRREPWMGQRLEILTSPEHGVGGQHPRVWSLERRLSVVETGSLPPGRTGVPSPQALLLLSVLHPFLFLFLLLVVRSGPGLTGKRECLGCLLSPEPPSHLSSFHGTCGFALAQGHVFFPCTGLMRLRFLFRPSGTQQFIPTGKYKADGVLETVRLSGKLSRNPWLCLGPVSFHISKSFLHWGGARLPRRPGLQSPPPGAGVGTGGGFGGGLLPDWRYGRKRLMGGLRRRGGAEPEVAPAQPAHCSWAKPSLLVAVFSSLSPPCACLETVRGWRRGRGRRKVRRSVGRARIGHQTRPEEDEGRDRK